MLYEFITPSDGITFHATTDAVAFCAAVILGGGKAFCTREDGVKLDTCVAFMKDDAMEETLLARLGMRLGEFIEANKPALADAFDSFAYTKMHNRAEYDAALAACTTDECLAAFRAKHDDEKRTSMSQWVKAAWKYAAALRRQINGQA